MAKLQVIKETPMNMAQVSKELERIKEADKTLNFRAQKTEEYLQQFCETKKAQEIVEKLVKLGIPRLKEQHIHKIVDTMPGTVEELKVILQGYTITVNNDNMKKIADTLNEAMK